MSISPLYPCVELLTASLFVFAFLCAEDEGVFIAWAITFTALVSISLSDGLYRVIPNKILLLIVASIPINTIGASWESLTSQIFFGVVASGILYLCWKISKGAIGGGDVKLLMVLSFVMTKDQWFVMLSVSVLVAAVWILFKRNKGMVGVAFAPFVLVGVSCALFFGEQIGYYFYGW